MAAFERDEPLAEVDKVIPEDADLNLSREATIALIAYRAEKRFRIFSWANSLLLGAIGGQAFFSSTPLDRWDRIFLSLTIVLLTGWSVFWLRFNRRALSGERKYLREIEKMLRVYRHEPASEPRNIYEWSTITLGALALVMTLVA